MIGFTNSDLYMSMLKKNSADLFKKIDQIECNCQSRGFIFRNKYFDLYPLILVANKRLRKEAEETSESMIRILEKVCFLYKQDPATKDYFMLTELQDALVSIENSFERNICVSRFDALLTYQNSDFVFKILENNTDCPAGVLFTGRIMSILKSVDKVNQFLLDINDLSQDEIESDSSFINALLSAYSSFNHNKQPTLCVLQLKGQCSFEAVEIVKAFESLGLSAYIADPRDLLYKGNLLQYNNIPINLIWNKINTTYFNELLNKPEDIKPFITACKDKSICHVNSFSARYITESKLCLSYLMDERFYHHFTVDEVKLVKKVLPWAHKLNDEMVSYNGKEYPVIKLAKKYKNKMVLKAAYDIRGDGVTIGKSMSDQEWDYFIGQSLGKLFILQEYIDPPPITVPKRNNKFEQMKFSMDMFMFNGKFQGFGSKVSTSDKLNVFQGGSKLSIFSEK